MTLLRNGSLLLLLLLCLALPACTLDIPLEDEVSDPDAISDVETAQSALASCYKSFTLWQYNTLLSARSDDFTPTPRLPQDVDRRNTYLWNPRQLVLLAGWIWGEAYHTVAQVNVLLERLEPLIANAKPEERKRYVGMRNSAQALQAYVYFLLAQLYGDNTPESPSIPLLSKAELAYPSRGSRREAMDRIRGLLQVALQADAQESWMAGCYWFNPMASCCLLAEVELLEGNYARAKQYAYRVVEYCQAKGQPAAASYASMWGNASAPPANVLLAVDADAYPGYREFDSWSDATQGDVLVVNPMLRYHSDDLRLAASYSAISMPDEESSTGTRDVRRYGKYNALRNANQPIRYVVLYRAADALLLAAEAEAHLGNASAAVELLNRLLASRKAPEITSPLSGDALLQRIFAERQLEFVGEGKRFYDLKRMAKRPDLPRYKRFLAEGNPIAPSDFRWLLPIPPSEAKYNGNIVQNPGWASFVPSK